MKDLFFFRKTWFQSKKDNFRKTGLLLRKTNFYTMKDMLFFLEKDIFCSFCLFSWCQVEFKKGGSVCFVTNCNNFGSDKGHCRIQFAAERLFPPLNKKDILSRDIFLKFCTQFSLFYTFLLGNERLHWKTCSRCFFAGFFMFFSCLTFFFLKTKFSLQICTFSEMNRKFQVGGRKDEKNSVIFVFEGNFFVGELSIFFLLQQCLWEKIVHYWWFLAHLRTKGFRF